MSASAYVFATSCTEPDEEFTSVHAMARAIIAKRDRVKGDGARSEPACINAMLSRGGAPCMQVVVIRLLDGSCGGRGEFLGYAMVHGSDGLARLRQALADVAGVKHAMVA